MFNGNISLLMNVSHVNISLSLFQKGDTAVCMTRTSSSHLVTSLMSASCLDPHSEHPSDSSLMNETATSSHKM